MDPTTDGAPAARFDAGLLALMGFCAALAIAGAYGLGAPWLHYATKPAATLVAVLIALRAPGADAIYRRAIVIGLLASTAGDVFLMFDARWFAAGLGSFLVAHLCYLRAFLRGARFAQRRGPYVVYGLLAAVLLTALWASVPEPLRIAVVLYVAALCAMAAQAAGRAFVRGDAAGRWAALGSATFVVSDAILAWDRFRSPFAAATFCVLALYWIAQACIAISVRESRI